MHTDIAIEDRRWQAIAEPESLISRILAAAVAAAGDGSLDDAELSIVLTCDDNMRRLNRDYRGKDRATNVLSFPVPAHGPGSRMLGDIVLAFETVAREAEEQNKSLADHVSHLVLHGFLHLLGHDHEADDDAERMEAFERSILASVGIGDPYVTDGSGAPPSASRVDA